MFKYSITFLGIIVILTFTGCISYTTIISSKDYKGDKILVQRFADPCCGWAGLRFVYKEGKKREYVIFYYWFDVPYVEKEVRDLDGKHVIHSVRYQLIFDTSRYRERYMMRGFASSDSFDINDELLSTKFIKPTIPLNPIDSILLFHAPHLLTSVNFNEKHIWLLSRAAGYVQAERRNRYQQNGNKAIK